MLRTICWLCYKFYEDIPNPLIGYQTNTENYDAAKYFNNICSKYSNPFI